MHSKWTEPTNRGKRVARPPRLAAWLLGAFSPPDEREGLAGDLAEEYRRYRLPLGGMSARRWYWGQVIRSLLPGLTRPSVRRSVLPRDPTPRRELSMHDLFQDLRYAIRSLIHAPAFTLITVSTLALAIGVNSAIFSMVSIILFSDLPMKDGETLGFVFMRNVDRGLDRQDMSLLDFVEYREGVSAFEALAGMRGATAVLAGTDEPARVQLGEVTANLFDVWRTTAMIGRTFLEGEDVPGAPRVALLSHGTWERRFASDPAVVGQTIKIDGYPTTIVGVMGDEFEVGDLSLTEIWVPLPIDPDIERRDRRSLFVTGRLRPGATLEQAKSEVAAVSTRLQGAYPEANANWSGYVQDFRSGLADSSFWRVLYLLGVTVGLVMLIACSNVATMMLARASARARELAVRAALGAGRLRITRQLLTESAVVSLVGGLLGLGVARVSLLGLTWIADGDSSISAFFKNLTLDRHVLLFTLGISVLAPLLFGLVPAWKAARTDLGSTLKDGGGRSSGNQGALRGRRFLVATQVALALTLMVAAGQLIRSMIAIRSMDLGYEPAGILTLQVELPEASYPELPLAAQFFDAAGEQIRAQPGVDKAAWVSARPGERGTTNLIIEGRDGADLDRLPWVSVLTAERDYFDIMGLSTLAGRQFDVEDSMDSAPVALVNSEAVERYWPGEDPVGQQVRFPETEDEPRWIRVIGVVSSEMQPDPENPAIPQIYLPLRQRPQRGLALMVRSRTAPADIANAIRQQIWAIDGELPVADARTLGRILDDSMATMNAVLSMFGAFALFALVMAAGGIYGVLSFAVGQRTREFGIRMALGAQGTDVRGMVMRNSAVLVVAGLAAGLVGAYLLSRVMANGVSGVEAFNSTVYLTVASVLAGVAALAAYIPALRATHVDPIIALKTD